MHEPTSTNPTPTAVPWTPDLMTPQAPPPTMPSPAPIPVAPQTIAQPPYRVAPQYHTPQPVARQPIPPQPMQAFTLQPHPQPQGHPQAQPVQATPMHQQAHYAPPTNAPQMTQAHNVQHQNPQAKLTPSQYAPATTPHHVLQAVIPPLAPPHMQAPVQTGPAPSKSLVAKLLKRAPKPNIPAPDHGVAALQNSAASGSLFNKNFALGAVTGLLVGAFVLPMLMNMIGGSEAPAQTQALAAASSPTLDVIPATTNGDTFIDQAISADAP